MFNDIFLNPHELEVLTNRKRGFAQMKVLRFMGIEHKRRPDGSVAVLRSHIKQVFGDNSNTAQTTEIEPDWSAV